MIRILRLFALLSALAGAVAPAAALTPAPRPLAAEERQAAWVERARSWLEELGRFRARFTQIGPDGSVATGTLWVWRPGRMRIEYDPPSRVLMVATDWRLVFHDAASGQTNVLPLSETPLAFLLGERVELDGRVRVVLVEEGPAEVALTVEDAGRPGAGSVTLIFAREPFRLVRWEVVDAQGLTTVVLVDSIEPDAPMDRQLFVWHDPRLWGDPTGIDR